jgi:hypothetical protein
MINSNIIKPMPATLFTEKEAIEIAKINNDGDDWNYIPEHSDKYSKIKVFDEENYFLGYL